jgi:hypothetical protein
MMETAKASPLVAQIQVSRLVLAVDGAEGSRITAKQHCTKHIKFFVHSATASQESQVPVFKCSVTRRGDAQPQ